MIWKEVISNNVPLFIGFTISGCCANVYTFEKILQLDSKITTLVTFSQYLFIFLSFSVYLRLTGFWKIRKSQHVFSLEVDKINLEFWIPMVLQNISAYIGNLVFQYNLSMPTHIIFRSSNTAITIFLGWTFWNKRYSFEKIIGSTLIAIGTIIFTIFLNSLQTKDTVSNNGIENNVSNTLLGIFLLILATVINSITSLYKETIYQDEEKGLNWKEVIYYNYLYGLVFYIPFLSTIYREFQDLQMISIISNKNIVETIFLMNWITQLLCIIGVNILVFRISALSLTIVLLVRRFLSLILSVYIFGNSISGICWIGVLLVFFGAFIYSFGIHVNSSSDKIKLKNV